MLLVLPATICLLLLIGHSLYCRPLRATLLIFGLGLPASMLYGGPDFYVFNVPTMTVPFMFLIADYPVPIINIVGFLFTFYTSLSLAIHIYERRNEQGERVVSVSRLVAATVYLSVCIGIAMEYTNLAVGWWTWTIHEDRPTGAIMNFFRWFGVWGWRSVLLFPILLQFFVRRRSGIRRVRLLCLVWFFGFGAWMVFVDIIPGLREPTLLLWLSLPLWVKYFPKPEVSLDLLQYNRPAPLAPRLGRWWDGRKARRSALATR